MISRASFQNVQSVNAASQSVNAASQFASESSNDSEVTEEQGTALGGLMFNSVALFANNLGSSIEPISILFAEAVLSMFVRYMPDQFGKYSPYLGMMNSMAISIFVIIIFLILKVGKYIPVLKDIVKEVDSKIGLIFNITLPFLMFAYSVENGDYSMGNNINTMTASIGNVSSLSTGIFGAISPSMVGGFLLCILASIYMTISYLIMNTVVYALDIILTNIPIVRFFYEGIKPILVFVILIISIVAPWFFIALYIIAVITGILLFRVTYPILRYYKNIYIHPIFKSKAVSLISDNTFSKYFDGQNQVTMHIPAFARTNISPKIKNYDKCYLSVINNNVYLIKPGNEKKQEIVPLIYSMNSPFKIRKGNRFIEIYILDENFKPAWYQSARRHFSIIISKEYFDQFDNMVNLLGFEKIEPNPAFEKLFKNYV
ncbi:MAG: hypothetical protein K6E10_05210 [Eubacterium sp.]|nr:hypothetical protein [Eubacterium sp.]